MWRVGFSGKTKCINAINVEWRREKSLKSINVEGGFFLWGVECFKICKREFTFIREMRVSQERGEDSSLFRAICMQCLCTPNAFCRFTLP